MHIYQVFQHDTHYQHTIISQGNNIFTVFFYTLSLDKLNIPKGYSDVVNRRRTDHTMAKRNKDKWTNNYLYNIMLKVKYRATRTPPVVLSEHNCLSCLYCTTMHGFCHCLFSCLYYIHFFYIFISNYSYREEHVSCSCETIAARYRHMWATV